MEEQISRQRFQPRKRVKTEHSQRENTRFTREWESSKVGLESGLLKLDRNKRVAICRERARMKKKKEWRLLTTKEQGDQEAAMIKRLTEHYEKEKNALRQSWYEENEHGDDMEMHDDKFSDDGEGMNDSGLEFETDEGGEEIRSPQSKADLSQSIAGIYNQTLGNIQSVFENFEKWGSYEEEPAEDDQEFENSDEQEIIEEVPESKENEEEVI